MRTSLNEIKNIELKLQSVKTNPEEHLIWKAELLANNELNDKVRWQKKAYQIIRYLGRRSLKKELNALHHDLMVNPVNKSFQQKIREIFLNA